MDKRIFTDEVIAKGVNYLKSRKNKYVGRSELATAMGMSVNQAMSLAMIIRQRYLSNIKAKSGVGTMWVDISEKDVSPVNHEHYSDSTPYQALKEPKKNSTIQQDSLWKVQKADGTSELYFVVAADDYYVHCLVVRDKDPNGEMTLLDSDHLHGTMYVDPARLIMKPVKYFIDEESFTPDHGQIKSIRDQISWDLGCCAVIPIEKIVEKEVIKEVPKKEDESLEVILLRQKVEIYESILKAQNLLLA